MLKRLSDSESVRDVDISKACDSSYRNYIAAYYVFSVAEALDCDDFANANHYFSRYFELTGENKQDYLDKIEAESK